MSTKPDIPGLLLATCAVALTALAAFRTFAPNVVRETSGATSIPLPLDEWEDVVAGRDFLGPADAPVKIVEFADFECPACRGYVSILDSIRSRYPRRVATAVAHYPLSYHRFALPAARAAECAQRSDRFEEIARLLLLGQDSLGLKPWRDFAAQAGVDSLDSFERCVKESGPMRRVQRDIELGNRIGVGATPTLVVNGLLFNSPPSLDVLDSLVQFTHTESR